IIHGGDIIDYINNNNYNFHWNFTSGFVNDINSMWHLYQKNLDVWNREIGNMQQMYNKETDMLHGKANSIMVELINLGILNISDEMCFSFKNRQIKEFLMKVGNLLELFVCTSASVIKDEEGNKFFDDIRVGVNIDWDGIYHDVTDVIKDTKNEIDVILMKNNIPVFISCKSGDLNVEELYKLHTVALKFGGTKVKKVLLISDFNKKGVARSYYLQRAEDMDITVETDVHKYSVEDLNKLLVGLFDESEDNSEIRG
nr:DUF1887 family protein [Lachnospiraceae bacterium]